MENDESRKPSLMNNENEPQSAVNSLILNYYKKFGRKRDLEQFFSLSTAHSEVRDRSGSFWSRMKALSDSSDSGDKRTGSPTELCRISIQIPGDQSASQNESKSKKLDSESPPIISEDMPGPSRLSDNESAKSDDNQSQKSIDVTLDTSINKPLSPTSSITSQRKLEWDSLADVGYANESDRKTSASSLSTLERLALKPHCSSNESKECELGNPTAHSTLVDITNVPEKPKRKKYPKKLMEIHEKDVDIVEVNVPSSSNPQAINVNLTKHISFNVDKDGGVTVQKSPEGVNISPVKKDVSISPAVHIDKEIQTSMSKSTPSDKDRSEPKKALKSSHSSSNGVPIYISLNTIRKRIRKRRARLTRKNKKTKSKSQVPLEKSGEPVSEAESFEYMPGHIYNQNQFQAGHSKTRHSAGNKSSLESSGLTTESSKYSNASFTKELEKCIDLLQHALKHNHDNTNLKRKLVKEIVRKLLNSKYRDEDSTDLLSLSSKMLGLKDYKTSTSTSDANVSDTKESRPQKSILRMDRFNSSAIASTSQSAPNLPFVANSEKPIVPEFTPKPILTSHTESDVSSKGKDSSDNRSLSKKTSQELYIKYLEALKREESYKRHLQNKDRLMKQKLIGSEDVRVALQEATKSSNKLKDLIKDLARNNYDDGSGDASKLEGAALRSEDGNGNSRLQRSHSVFTLSSGRSDKNQSNQERSPRPRNRHAGTKTETKKCVEEHYCCCPHHSSKCVDSSTQVNQPSQKCEVNEGRCDHGFSRQLTDNIGQMRHVCLCNDKNCTSRNAIKDIIAHSVPYFTNHPDCQRDMTAKPKESEKEALHSKQHRDYSERTNKMETANRSKSENSSKSKSSNGTGNYGMKNTSPQATSSRNSPERYSPQPSTSKAANEPNRTKGVKSNTSSSSRSLNIKTQSSQTNMIAISPSKRKASIKNTSIDRSEVNTPRNNSPGDTPRSPNTKKKIVHEGTRWTQTEISINPKISDPSLTDVHVVSDKNTARLVSEEYREVILKPTLTSPCASTSHSPERVMSPKRTHAQSSDIKEPKLAKSQSTQNEDKIRNPLLNEQVKHDNYTIPLQGTNMILTVSIDKNKANIDNEAPTNGTRNVEKVTSTQELGIDKATQETDEPINNEQGTDMTPRSDASDAINDLPEYKHSPRYGRSSDTKYSTYPAATEKKSILRSSTDYKLYDKSRGDENKKPEVPKGLIQDVCQPGTSSMTMGFTQKEKDSSSDSGKDPTLDMIRDITKRYSKNDLNTNKRKKCFKEIISVLNYLLDTEDSSDGVHEKQTEGATSPKDEEIPESPSVKSNICSNATSAQSSPRKTSKKSVSVCTGTSPRVCQDKGVQLTPISVCVTAGDSSDIRSTSTDSATCRILSKIKKECEKYHYKRCKSQHAYGKKCEGSSSTSVNFEECKIVHRCPCKLSHKCGCNRPKTYEKVKNKCVAYNLILQTSDSVIEDDKGSNVNKQPLKHIVVKVPSKKFCPIKEIRSANKFCQDKGTSPSPVASPRASVKSKSGKAKTQRSRSLPNKNDVANVTVPPLTVRDYLEKNRPDFIENTSSRQNCLKMISESRANERATKHQLLSMQLARQSKLSSISERDLNHLAKELGIKLRHRKAAPKFISEHEMKKHSEKIYKSLPEVVQKKENMKKENIKKTNLLMAYIFKKNLQKKTLRGSVNISNYSTVIKI